MKRCPFCAEEIQDAAIVCRFCGRDLPVVQTVPTAPPAQPVPMRTSGRLALLALIGLVVAAVVLSVFVAEEQKAGEPPLLNSERRLGVKRAPDDARPLRPMTPEEIQATERRPGSEWTTLIELSGEGIKNTQSFRTASREWRVSYNAGSGYFGLMVYDASGGLVTVAANRTEPGSDTSYVRTPPGEYYLGVNATSGWSLKVEHKP